MYNKLKTPTHHDTLYWTSWLEACFWESLQTGFGNLPPQESDHRDDWKGGKKGLYFGVDIHGGIGAHACLKHCFQDTDNIPRIIYGKNKSRVIKMDIQLSSPDQTVVWLFLSRFVRSCWHLDNHYCLRESKGSRVLVMRCPFCKPTGL